MMSWQAETHSSQMKTPEGPWMSLRTWLRVLPQKEQRTSGTLPRGPLPESK